MLLVIALIAFIIGVIYGKISIAKEFSAQEGKTWKRITFRLLLWPSSTKSGRQD